MSLKIWLPLNGTLDNQGLDDVVVTNNGATIDNNGKIGKCYNFNGNDSGIKIQGSIIPILAQGDFSISFWVYNDDQGNCSVYIATISSSSYSFAIQKTTEEGLRIYWQSSPDYYPTNFTIPIQEWCHIAVVIKNNNCYCYKNGILVASRKDNSFTPEKLTYTWLYGMLGRDSMTGATVLKGKINDFRWYDHALSSFEVKQISQGLILHYPLNNININENIEYDCSGYCHNGQRIGTFEYVSDTPKYDMAIHINSESQKIYIQGLTTVGFGDSYSFAWWGKRNSNSSMFWGFSNGIRLNGMYTGKLWNTSDASDNPLYEIGTTTQVAVPTVNVWHHYVMTGDGQKNYVYLDGELWAESKIYKSISGTAIYINGFDNQTHYSSNNMSISDFRIYATALSAEDILALYKNSIYIDNQGSLYGAELREI